PHPLPRPRAEDRPEGAGSARVRSGNRGPHDRALLGSCRHVGREKGIPRDGDPDRTPRLPPDRRVRARLVRFRLRARRAPHRAGTVGGQGGCEAAPSPHPDANGLWTSGLKMPAITPDSLMTLEAYAKSRKQFRAEVLAHKKDRTVHLGDHVTIAFEDE